MKKNLKILETFSSLIVNDLKVNKMKTLEKDEMLRLRELGVDTSDASMVMLFVDNSAEYLTWDDVSQDEEADDLYFYYDIDGDIEVIATKILLDAETGDYDHSFRETCGVFTVDDLIMKLPGVICITDESGLRAEVITPHIEGFFNTWRVSYINHDSGERVISFSNISLLRALFEILEHIYTEYSKIGKNKMIWTGSKS